MLPDNHVEFIPFESWQRRKRQGNVWQRNENSPVVHSPAFHSPALTRVFVACLNSDSAQILEGCLVEPSLAQAKPALRVQFERLGYFCVDPDSTAHKLVFNRTVALRDTWAKIEKAQGAG